MNLNLDSIAKCRVSGVPPWIFFSAPCFISFHKSQVRKSQTDPLVFVFFFRTKFHELLPAFLNHESLFTDGSQDGGTAGSACVTPPDT